MKNKTLKILTLVTIVTAGLSFGANFNTAPTQVAATQQINNYADYAYTGNYYDGLNFTDSDGMQGDFRKSLSAINYPAGFYTYGSTGENNLSTHLQYADQDPNNSANMIYFYTRDSVKKNPATTWNREHVWPQSLSSGNWGTSVAGTDLLHIRPTYNDTNSNRGNLVFGNMNKNSPAYYNSMLFGYIGGYFEPLDSVKGDVARILMYVWTTYYDHYSSKINLLNTVQSYDLLLTWHTQDKPDALEGLRNDYAQTSKQKNRNPFVDRPEYAWKIFGENVNQNVLDNCVATYPGDGSQTGIKKAVSISLSGEPAKKIYQAGQTFDPTGLTVNVTYDDDSTGTITNDKVSWLPNPLTASTTSITCQYGQLSATYTGITVEEVTNPNPTGTLYNIDFVASGADGGTELNGASILSSYVEVNTLVSSIADTYKIFPGRLGLKLGSSSANGKLTLNLKNEAKNKVISVKIYSEIYGSDSAQLMFKVDGDLVDTYTPNGEYNKTLNQANINSISIESIKRIYLKKVVVEIEPPIINLETISLAPENANLYVGESLQLVPTFTPNNATNKMVNYYSSNESVATVSDSGLVSAIKKGAARITVKNNDETIEAYCDIVVQDRPSSSSSSEPSISAPISSSSEPSSSDSSTPSSGSSNQPNSTNKGCNNFAGSVASAICMVGFAIVLLIKKKY